MATPKHAHQPQGLGVTIALALILCAATAEAARSIPPNRGGRSPHVTGVGPELLPYNPVANEFIVINSTDGRARFTILTDRLIRLEYSSSSFGGFEDRASLAFVNRNVAAPSYTVQQNNAVTEIFTDFLHLHYVEGDSASGFTPDNLSIEGKGTGKTSFRSKWKPGDANPGQLPGTIKSLDALGVQTLNCTEIAMANITVHDEKLHCNWALFSRLGWTLFDDTTTPLIDPKDPDGWWQPEEKNANVQDWYFFGHGLDYLAALRDYRTVGGVIPMLPKQIWGTWWTRWFNYNTHGIQQVVNNFREYSLPLDVLVYDMNWHIKDGSPDGWTGYTWDQRVLPNYLTLNRWLKSQNLMLAANIHDAEGVGPNESRYAAAAAAAGVNANQTVPFSVANKTLMLAVEDQVLYPLISEDKLDFFWIDWQQGGTKGGALGDRNNPTFWLNKVRSTDPKRMGSKQRTLVLGRWGGLGNHRYQLGFSGDINDHQQAPINWPSLAYQPYFSAQGGNVGYGFWSHDILTSGIDPELSLRWIQWGAFSSIMRIHDRGLSSGGCNDPFHHPGQIGGCEIDLIWKQPYNYFQPMRLALQRRAALMPYLYNAAREAFDTGVSLIRPLYYYYSDLDMAYANNMHGDYTSYFLGPDMVIAPVVVPCSSDTNLATTEIWLPPENLWIETNTGSELVPHPANGSIINHDWDLTEVPTYVKDGAIIPVTMDAAAGDTIGTAGQAYKTLGFEIFPCSDANRTRSVFVYEDDGQTTEYLGGDYGQTEILVTGSGKLTLKAPQKVPKWMPATREYIFIFVNSQVPSGVNLNGQVLPYDDLKLSDGPSYYYDGSRAALVVATGSLPIDKSVEVEILGLDKVDEDAVSLSGLRGVLSRANLAKNALDAVQGTPGFFNANQGALERLAVLGPVVEGLAASGDADSANQALAKWREMWTEAIDEVVQTKENDNARKTYALQLLRTAIVEVN